VRDLGRGQAAEHPQGERDADVQRERRVAAGEDQPEAVVVHGALLHWFVLGVQQRRLGLLVGARRLPSQSVDRPVPRGRDDPSRRTGRYAALRPLLDRGRKRVLHRVLGDLEVPEHPGKHGHRPPVLSPEDRGEIRSHD
jgi:hypothetical protein